MKFFLFTILIWTGFAFNSSSSSKAIRPSPLADYSSLWNDSKYLQCNTAADANYMSDTEKEVIYVLNMARMDPVLFAKTVVAKYPDKTMYPLLRNSSYYKSLLATMLKLKPVNIIKPDSLCYNSALCHAINSGIEGYTGHIRSKDACRANSYFNAECCDYGHNSALAIIMSFLIDDGIPSLGHRDICLSKYDVMGVSIQPHIYYSYNAVLDFHYK